MFPAILLLPSHSHVCWERSNPREHSDGMPGGTLLGSLLSCSLSLRQRRSLSKSWTKVLTLLTHLSVVLTHIQSFLCRRIPMPHTKSRRFLTTSRNISSA